MKTVDYKKEFRHLYKPSAKLANLPQRKRA